MTNSPWPLGPVLEAARIERGLSTREAARRAGVSDTQWRNLERGFELRKGTRLEVSPRVDTVAKVARAIGLDVKQALELAGLPTVDADVPPDPDLSGVSDEALLDEVRRRMQLHHRGRITREDATAEGITLVGVEDDVDTRRIRSVADE